MASTWSDLKFELIGTGDQSGTWGGTTNDNIGIAIQQAIGGKADVTMSSTSITLSLTDTTALQNARALYLNLTGTPGGAATLNVPAVQKAYIVYNNTTGGFAVTVKVTGQTGVSVPNGKTMVLYDNGTDVVDAITHLSSLTLGSALPVGSGGTGITSLGTGVATALGNNVNTTGGLVTQSGTLAASALLLGGGSGTAISSTTTGTNVVTALGNNANSANGIAVLNASGLLAVAQGGTNATSTPTAGAVAYGTGSAYAFNTAGSSGQPLLSAGSSAPTFGTLSVAGGGTGATTLTANNVILGNGTSAVQFVAPGSSGNILTSNGTTWTSAAAGASLSGVTDSASPFETSLGYQAGNVSTGVNNTFVGYQAGLLNSTGTRNTAVGHSSLYSNTTGANNAALGDTALYSNTSGGNNTAIGKSALATNTTGSFNIALGGQALQFNTTANFNTALGHNALGSNTTANDNTAVGYGALDANTTGTGNVAIGVNALGSNTTAPNNIAIGNSALVSGTTGQQNVAIGTSSAQSLTTGSENTALGDGALGSITTQSGSTAIGRGALYSDTGGSNTALGRLAGYAVTTGTQNILIGYGAGNSGTNNLTTGSNNILIGYNAAASSATVSNEVTIGNTSITSTRLRGMVQLNAAMFEQATVSATAATGTINYDTRTQSVLYYTSNASANWTLNIRGASGVSLDSIMSTGQSITVAFLVTNGATAYYQSAFQVDGSSVTPKWQGGTAPTSGNASSVDIYVITVIKTGSATFTAFASQTKFA